MQAIGTGLLDLHKAATLYKTQGNMSRHWQTQQTIAKFHADSASTSQVRGESAR